MSPFKRKKLNIIRKRLDKLDNSLIRVIKNRTLLVKEVLKLKEYKKNMDLIQSVQFHRQDVLMKKLI